MSKWLVIAEKPSVALDYANAMGPYEAKEKGSYYETSGYVISFAVGHLLELSEPESYNPDWRRWSLKQLPMIPEAFTYKPRDKRASTRLNLLKKLAKRKDVVGIVNGCDAGREGEHIFRTVYNHIGIDLPMQRLWLSSMTKASIRKGFGSMAPGESYDALAAAAASRAEADWLIGMNATRALTRRLKSFNYQGAWSVGRVQTPTLSMVVERELAIQRHRPETYWEVMATFKAADHTYEAQLVAPNPRESAQKSRIFDGDEAKAISEALSQGPQATASEVRKRVFEKAPLPYDLTSLQRASGLTAKRTQDIAQALYERHKLLSYPRTDSRALPEDQLPGLEGKLNMVAGHRHFSDVVQAIRKEGPKNLNIVFNDAKVTDHHAIIPVGTPGPNQLDDTELRIYRMVVAQFLASMMPPAEWENVNRTTTLQGANAWIFKSKGKMLMKPGWKQAMGKEAGFGSSLAALSGDQVPVSLTKHELEERATKPPGRFTDAGLLGRMESCGKEIEDADLSAALRERGLGTPATRADTIERLIGRGYLVRQKRNLRATAKALRLLEVVTKSGVVRLSSVELTGDMEFKLRQVEAGLLSRQEYMSDVVSNADDMTQQLVGFDFDDMYGSLDAVGPCPDGSGASVWETPWGYSTRDDSTDPFFIWKDIGGHVLTRDEIADVLTNEEQRLGPMTLYPRGDASAPGYQAYLNLKRFSDEEYATKPMSKAGNKPSRWRLAIEPVGVSDAASDDEDIERIVGDLITTPDGLEIVETTRRFIDRESAGSDQRPKAVLPKEVCQRPITVAEAMQYFMEGETEVLSSFVSKKGRFFKAKLIRKDNGRHGFEFPPRAPRKPAASKSDA